MELVRPKNINFQLFLGIIARGFLVCIKPIALLYTINFDGLKGARLAEVFLIGLLFVSLLGTNAHRVYYEKYFKC